MPEGLALGTGPVSFGVDFADAPSNPPWDVVLDGIAAAGYRWMELGPLGYLPDDVAPALAERGLGVTAGFVFAPLDDPATLRVTRRVAERVKRLGGRFLVIIDAVRPDRPEAAQRLDGALVRAVAEIAEIARGSGLRPVVHPHAGTRIQLAEEVEPLLDLVELCLDTGHWAYAGQDPIAAYQAWSERIPYVHLKDVKLGRRGGGFWESVRRGVFTPLGSGDVDLPGFLRALGDFRGWAIVEQDRVPGGDPVADLIAGREYLERLM